MTTKTDSTKILVIDDERLIRLTLNAKLKQIGYTAVCVASISEAVVLLNDGGHKQFTAIITDIMMADMNGFVFRDIVRGMDLIEFFHLPDSASFHSFASGFAEIPPTIS